MIDGDRLTVAGRALGEVPLWLVVVAVLAGLVAAGAIAAVAPDRRAEALALVTVGVAAAGAALPDTEIVVLVVALLAVATVGVVLAPEVPSRWWPLVAAVTGLLVAWALVDGARGRAGTVLLAPVVVAPAAALARWPGRRTVGLATLRLAIAFAVGVLAARHAGLGHGTLVPLVGGIVGATVAVAGLRAAARPT